MAVFRVPKIENFTMMSNHHLRNKKLSLKAVGLMSKILSLPDEWDYSLKGLAKLNADGIDGVRSAVRNWRMPVISSGVSVGTKTAEWRKASILSLKYRSCQNRHWIHRHRKSRYR